MRAIPLPHVLTVKLAEPVYSLSVTSAPQGQTIDQACYMLTLDIIVVCVEARAWNGINAINFHDSFYFRLERYSSSMITYNHGNKPFGIARIQEQTALWLNASLTFTPVIFLLRLIARSSPRDPQYLILIEIRLKHVDAKQQREANQIYACLVKCFWSDFAIRKKI